MTMSEAGELSRKLVYHCRIFNVFEGDVRLPNGRVFNQTWIDHRPCIAVVPVNPEGKLVLIRQYRSCGGRDDPGDSGRKHGPARGSRRGLRSAGTGRGGRLSGRDG